MLILALLRDAKAGRLRAAVSSVGEIQFSTEWADLLESPFAPLASAAVVDPFADRTERTVNYMATGIASIATWNVPIIVYVDPQRAREVFHIVRLSASDLILAGIDDAAEELRSTLLRSSVDVPSAVLHLLQTHLQRLPVHVEHSVTQLFRRGSPKPSIRDLASRARMGIRSLYRTLDTCGLCPPSRLIVGARVAHAASALASSDASLELIARRFGYGSRATLTREFKQLVGLTPRYARLDLTPRQIAERLVESLVRD